MDGRNGAKVKMQVKKGIITKGRSESYGSIEDMIKRKRDESGIEGQGGEEKGEVFRTSKKTLRSPDVWSLGEKRLEETIRRLMREELSEMMKEIKELKGWREKLKEWRKEIGKEVKEEIREQREKLSKELEGMKKVIKEKEGSG